MWARHSVEDLALPRGLRLRRVDRGFDASTTTGELMPLKTPRIPTADGQADAFAAFPDHGERHPGVLMYSDGFGIRPVLRELARELAGHGYYVLVPNLFYRHGPVPVIELPEHIGEEIRPQVMAQLMPLIQAHTAGRVLSDADAYLRFLTAQPEVGAGPVAVTGYCIGGLLAMRTAAAHPNQVAAVAGFHGPVNADGPGLFSKLTAQVHLGHAESDITPEALSPNSTRLWMPRVSATPLRSTPAPSTASPCPIPTLLALPG
jgi:carboxymethylenebutenolidase